MPLALPRSSLLALALLLNSGTARADALDDLATAFGVPRGAVLEARRITLAGANNPWSDVVVGRYREGAGTAAFPGLAVKGPCDRGTCWHRVHLGPVASKVTLGALVDLDQPEAAIPPEALRQVDEVPGEGIQTPPERAALLVVVDEDVAPRTERHLVLVALSPQPHVVATVTLESRSPEGSDDRDTTPPIGTRVEGLRLGQKDGVRHLVVTERPIDSRWNRCLRSPAVTVVWTWSDGRFQRSTDGPVSRPCR